MSKDESNEGSVGVRELLVMEISYVTQKNVWLGTGWKS
jgi:hypothetical protein